PAVSSPTDSQGIDSPVTDSASEKAVSFTKGVTDGMGQRLLFGGFVLGVRYLGGIPAGVATLAVLIASGEHNPNHASEFDERITTGSGAPPDAAYEAGRIVADYIPLGPKGPRTANAPKQTGSY